MNSKRVDNGDLVPLRGSVQNYMWGKLGSTALVARLAAAAKLQISDSKCYAEIWYGTHKNGPSVVELPEGERPLLEYLGGTPLPFILKFLSVRTALSIQMHPDKTSAAQLHKQDSKSYPDSNHKPEMVVAVNEFEVLCGFRPLGEIIQFVKEVSEFRAMIGEKQAQDFLASVAGAEEDTSDGPQQAVKEIFTSVLHLNNPEDLQKTVKPNIVSLTAENSYPDADGITKTAVSVARRIAKDFPLDVGVFAVFFFNYYKLTPGEALFLPPRVPHAYISGDSVECMACSDNVIRAGLTPKPVHVHTLCKMLNYSLKLPDRPLQFQDTSTCSMTYCPPPGFKDFQLTRTQIPRGKSVELCALVGPSIIVAFSGSGTARRVETTTSKTSTSETSTSEPSITTTSEPREKGENKCKSPCHKDKSCDVSDACASTCAPCLPVVMGSAFLVPAHAAIVLTASKDEELWVYRAAANQMREKKNAK